MPSINVSMENFQSDVVDASQNMPVVLLFWAEQVPESAQVKVMAEQAMADYDGKAVLALSDVAQDQSLAPRLQVQGLPSIRIIHKGAIAEQIDGPIDETQLRTVMDALTQSSIEAMQGNLDQMLAVGDFAAAAATLQQSIQEEPNNQGLRIELADVLIRKGDLDDARTVLASIPEDTEGRARPQNRLEFVEEAAAMDSAEDLQAAVAANPQDLESRYALAIVQMVAGETELALQGCLDILREDREFRDDIGRLTMIRIFDVLGKGNEMATKYRRKLFNALH
ncbi:MAG: tetratricopeptide repeat protein [Luminiphilus sp.]|nr:tetratricopeptide repeat protein [Pseudomonadales bacterium]MBL6814281.1 tetratricopeptide repeat protein [Pseudomonadales bacterium]MBL6824100.1 tetratricopeptide repeat protein [Luminiphilus sp.]